MDVNVASMFLTCRAVVPVMRDAGRRQDRQHLVGHAVPRRAVPAPLRDEQGRHRRVHAGAGEGARQGRHPRQLRRARLHDVGRASLANPEVIEKLRDVSVAARTLQRDQVPEDVVGAVVFLCAPAAPTSSPARRWSSTAGSTSIEWLYDHPGRGRDRGRPAVVYDVERDEAHFGAARVDGHARSSGRSTERVRRATGSCALRPRRLPARRRRLPAHASRARASACLLTAGSASTRTASRTSTGRASAWYESGPEPVFAAASPTRRRRSCACCSCPGELEGKRTIRYVDPADEEKPKLQRATVYLEQRARRS